EYDDEAGHPRGGERPRDAVAFDHGLYQFYRAASRLRRDHSALRRGDLEIVLTDDAAKGLALQRTDDRETLVALFNRGEGEWTAELPIGGALGDGTDLREVFTATGNATAIRVEPGEGHIAVTIPGREAVVLHRFFAD
ncbi:MAG: hypothetical protein AAF805_15295, partial [Planctomycetota bacterium]